MPLNELEEIANAANQIIEDHRAGQVQGDKHIRRALIVAILALIVVTIAGWYIQYRLAQPALPAVRLSIATLTPNPLLCPGDVLNYVTTLDIEEPVTGRAVIVIRNMDTKRQEFSTSADAIYWPENRTVSTSWVIPAKLPATPTRPERAWTPGQYRREVSVVSYETNMQADPQFVNFRIAANCKGVTQ